MEETIRKPRRAKSARSRSGKAASKDLFLEREDRRSDKRQKKSSREGLIAVNLLLTAGIIAMLALGVMTVYRHRAFLEMKAVVEAQTFYDGTTVEGFDVSGMTLSAALDYWRRNVEPNYAERTVTLGTSTDVTAQQLGYQSDYEAVLNNAWSAGRRGSLEERYTAALRRQYHPVAYDVTRRLYSEAALDACVTAVAQRVDLPAQNAEIASFDVENYTFVYTDSQEGRVLDQAVLRQSIVQALEAGGGQVALPVKRIAPTVTQETVAAQYGMIASAVTNASSSSSNRLKNIRQAMSFINGYRLEPGATFSFNETVGQRTTDRGFYKATAYSGGTVTEEIGGGICQVSTTLFNAAVKSDLEIVERHSHSLTVSYVDRGKDAAVNWGSQDLRFKNNTDEPIYICCFLSDDKRVRFGLFGRLLPNGETITVEGVTTETIQYETEYQPSIFLGTGEMQVLEKGKNGYRAEAYKLRWDAQGNQLSRELLCRSAYKVVNEIIQYGP